MSITRYELEEMYDDMLNECYDDYRVGDVTFVASYVLYNCDPISYDAGFQEYIDVLLSDGVFTEKELQEAGVL
jgi:hypothetical protein